MTRYTIYVLILIPVLIAGLCSHDAFGQTGKNAVLKIKKTKDFRVTGEGVAENWSKTEWIQIPHLPRGNQSSALNTRAKVLYSETGMYFLFQCEDRILNATMEADFMELWNEDVVEVFLWPDDSVPLYFEYELSPLNYELPILVDNNQGNLLHWQPYSNSYKGNRKTRHETSVEGGKKESGESISRWTAEFFIPYMLLRPLNNIPPEKGSRWRGNLYRIDYDKGQTLWAWQPTEGNFHEYEKFGTFLFE